MDYDFVYYDEIAGFESDAWKSILDLMSTSRTKIEFTGLKIEKPFGGWSRTCRVDGVNYHVSISRGKPVRIPYKPRGQNRGWKWNGSVYSEGKQIWHGDVPGSLGVRGVLIDAGVLDVKDDDSRGLPHREADQGSDGNLA